LADLPSNALWARFTCINKCILICDVGFGKVDGVLQGRNRYSLTTFVYTIKTVMPLCLCLSINARLLQVRVLIDVFLPIKPRRQSNVWN
jgi:hypothetical protein